MPTRKRKRSSTRGSRTGSSRKSQGTRKEMMSRESEEEERGPAES